MAAILLHPTRTGVTTASGDKLYFYEVGTTTDLTVYTDYALATPASQPVVADSNGLFVALYADSTGNDIKVVHKDTDDVERYTTERLPLDDLSSISSSVSTNAANITALQGQMTAAEADIDTLESESADYETRITTLEAVTAPDVFTYMHVRDEKASGTVGGSGTASTWNTRDLNTETYNGITGASLASNQVTLAAGTYLIEGWAQGFRTGQHKARLRNITLGTTIILGSSERGNTVDSSGSPSMFKTRVVLSAETDLELQFYYTSSSGGTSAYGTPTSAGVNEVYAELFITKIA